MSITFEQVRENPEINTYIRKADETMKAMGYTEHSFAHVTKTAVTASNLLRDLGYPARVTELAYIAGYMHDIGNVVNRQDHAQSGALLAYSILTRMGMGAEETASVITAIGNHDEGSAVPVSPIAAALILADKSDVRRSRVRNKANPSSFDIHDRVNYAVTEAELVLEKEEKTVTLNLVIDISMGSIMDYFEIFLQRMLLCRRAAEALELRFRLVINGSVLL